MRKAPLAAIAVSVFALGIAAGSAAADVLFLSTQLRPIEDAQKVREVLLKGGPKTTFVTEEPAQLSIRLKAELDAGKHTLGLIGAVHGELQPLVPMGVLDAVDDVVPKVASRGVPAGLFELGKLGTGKQVYIPWMQATYVLAVTKQALPYLPQGADINALTFQQLT